MAASRFPAQGKPRRVSSFRGIEQSFSAFGVACAELVSAQPGVAHGGFDVRTSPLDPALLVSLARQRAAFCLSTTAALGCPLSSLAHPETALALLAALRNAAAGALRCLAELRQIGTPGATALAVNLGASTRDPFLCNVVLASRVLVEGQPEALAVGLFPYGSCMA